MQFKLWEKKKKTSQSERSMEPPASHCTSTKQKQMLKSLQKSEHYFPVSIAFF